MSNQHRLGHDAAESARFGQPDYDYDQMNQKDDEITHPGNDSSAPTPLTGPNSTIRHRQVSLQRRLQYLGKIRSAFSRSMPRISASLNPHLRKALAWSAMVEYG